MSRHHQSLPKDVSSPLSITEVLTELHRLEAQTWEAREDLANLRTKVKALITRFRDGEPIGLAMDDLEEALS